MKKWYELRNAPEIGTPLCEVSDIAVGEVKEFTFGEEKKHQFHMFLYNDSGTIRGYVNKCPHFQVPLNVEPGGMFTTDRSQFMCMFHYAKFNIDSGHCTEGPCEGSDLEKIPLEIINNTIYVSVDF